MTSMGGGPAGPDEPFIDEHRLTVDKPAAEVWQALVRVVHDEAGPLRTVGAVLLGARPSTFSGELLTTGSTVPGFAVVRVRAPELLVLQGAHRFSRYTLVFRLDSRQGDTTISAVTAARFPGLHGKLYRALVIGSGLHRRAVRRLLHRIATGR